MPYNISLYLSRFLDVSYETREVDGVPQECLVIPMEKNGLVHTPGSESVVMRLRMYEMRANPRRQTHYLTVMLPKEKMKEYIEYGLYERFKFIGNAWMFFDNKKKGELILKGKTVEQIMKE